MHEDEHTHAFSTLHYTLAALGGEKKHFGGWTTHKHKTQGPSLCFSQTDSSMCRMSSSYRPTNTETGTLVLRERNAKLDQNILLGSQPGNFAQGKHLVLTHVKKKKTRCDDVSFWELNTCSMTSSLTSPFFFPPTSHFHFHTARATRGVSARTHANTRPHHSTTNLSASGIIPAHLTGPKRACCVPEQGTHTHTLVSTNHHFLNPCRTTGRRCASHTSCTPVGNPSPAPVNTRHCPPLTSGCDFQLASLM